jgi:hypothetical protein
MRIRFQLLEVFTSKTIEIFSFESDVTYLWGPIGAGKSSVARLVDYCFGGALEQTPAIQRHFVAARLNALVGPYEVSFERSAEDASSVRVTWTSPSSGSGSVNAPLRPSEHPIGDEYVYSLSDLIFWLSGLRPMKVRKSKHDPDSALERLSIRNILWYCYLSQDKLDSSFFRMDDPVRRYRSADTMRFFTGMHSARLSELDEELQAIFEQQRVDRETVERLRGFLAQFEIIDELQHAGRIQKAKEDLSKARAERAALSSNIPVKTHLVEPLREVLRALSLDLDQRKIAVGDIRRRIEEQESIKAELITAKAKASRMDIAASILQTIQFEACPCCNTDLSSDSFDDPSKCGLCGTPVKQQAKSSINSDALQRDVTARIDELNESVKRHKLEQSRAERELARIVAAKEARDHELSDELARYDSAQVATIRSLDRQVGKMQERIKNLEQLATIPRAINDLQQQAGALQGRIDVLRSEIASERLRLSRADDNIEAIRIAFREVLLAVGFPGVDPDDNVQLNPKDWIPKVVHGGENAVEWGFFDAGSGGKKTLFNVCYALALHRVALARGLPIPPFLIIDSPTKNMGKDINREIVRRMIREAYNTVALAGGTFQLLIIDSDFIEPDESVDVRVFERKMDPLDPDHPALISFYTGP